MKFSPFFPLVQRTLKPFLSSEPVSQMIRYTAKKEWRLITLNLGTSIVESISEGATLGIIFIAVKILTISSFSTLDWSTFSYLPYKSTLANLLNGLSTELVFILLIGLALLVQGIQSLCRYLNLISVSYFSARIRSIVIATIHKRILRFTYPFASSFKVGDLLEYALGGPDAIRIQIDQVSSLLILTLLSITYLLVLISISPWLLFAVSFIGGVIFFLQKYMLPRISNGSELVTTESVRVGTIVTEHIQALRLLHTTGQQDSANSFLVENLSKLEGALRKQAPRLSILSPVTSFLPIFSISLILVVSIFLLSGSKSFLLPSLVTFVLALQRLTIRVNMIANVTNVLADNTGRIKRLNSILSPDGKEFRTLDGKKFEGLRKDIRFDNVSLRYKVDSPLALDSVSFSIFKGSTVALVGPSGAGKSTIADLLTGLYTPSNGSILIDGIPLKSYNMVSWQEHLGVVSQDTFLFNTSIFENIKFGVSTATFSMVKYACDLAQASGFIETLPDSYDTIIGERGYRLSGGQRQRLSLARAFLRQPQLLILDEATSALDSQNEDLIQDAIAKFRSSTTLIIAHRLSTIVNADLIVVINSGLVVETGNHGELIRNNGMYKQLWDLQTA